MSIAEDIECLSSYYRADKVKSILQHLDTLKGTWKNVPIEDIGDDYFYNIINLVNKEIGFVPYILRVEQRFRKLNKRRTICLEVQK